MITAACFDLETSNLNADFGIVLCGVIKPAHGEPIIFRGDSYKTWKKQRSCDKGIVVDVCKELERYDILIGHNSARFDIAYLRTRLMKWNAGVLNTKKLVDPFQIVRNKLRLGSASLRALAQHLGVNEKTDVSGDLWLRAALDGDVPALDTIVDHCVRDVVTLERIVDAVKGYCTTFNAWGSGY